MASTKKDDVHKTIDDLQIGDKKWSMRVTILRKGEEETSQRGHKYMNFIFMDDKVNNTEKKNIIVVLVEQKHL